MTTTEYSHIDTIWKRDQKTGKILEGDFSRPELQFLAGNAWVWTEKIDGTNIRVQRNVVDAEGRVSPTRTEFGGKTDNAQIPVFLYRRLEELFRAGDAEARWQAQFPDNPPVVLYGEGYGAKIQKGGGNYKPDGVDFILFDVKVGRWWLERPAIEDVARGLGIGVVPVVGTGDLWGACMHVQNPGSFSEIGPAQHQAEGLVLRPAVTLFARNGERIITKIKARDYS